MTTTMRGSGGASEVVSGMLGDSGIAVARKTYDYLDTREFKQPLEQLLRNVMKTAPAA